MSAVRLDPNLARVLGLAETVTDPNALVIALLKKGTGVFRTLQNRCCSRAQLTIVTIGDADPKKSGKQQARVDLRASAKDGFGEVGAKLGTFFMRGAGAEAIMLDEARRMILGMPIGPHAKALDGPPDSLVTDQTMNLLAPTSARGIFGIDDAILIGAGVTLLATLIPIVLPMLVELGKGVFDMVTGADKKDAAPPPAPSAGPFDDLADNAGIGTAGVDDSAKGIAIVAGIVLVLGGVFWFLKKRAG